MTIDEQITAFNAYLDEYPDKRAGVSEGFFEGMIENIRRGRIIFNPETAEFRLAPPADTESPQ
jgi:hypothetical protein